MFSSFFKSGSSGGPAASFEVGPEVRLPHPEKHLFRLHEGTLKSGSSAAAAGGLGFLSSTAVSVFVCDNPAHLAFAAAAVKRLKTLRHPSVVTFVEANGEGDGGKVILATEKVTPLSVHLEQLDAMGVRGAPRDQYIAWGIFQVLRGLAFLTGDAKLRHNSLHGDAIFVTRSGDWKLFALDKVTSTDSPDLPAATLPALQKYDPPEVSDHSKRTLSTAWSRDMWGAGCIVWEVFNGPLPAAKNLGQLGAIPKKLTPLYMELVAANPSKRPNPKDRLDRAGYFKNDLVDVLLFLEELHLKDDSAKGRFYSSLGPMLENIPTHVGSYKILPELIKAFEFGNAGAAILTPVFKLGANLESEEYVRIIVPCLVKMFASNDRNARFKLLNQVEHFVGHLSDKLVNDEVFQHIQNGFLDQEPMIREKSVIAMIHLAPKLTYANLDECVVMKHFARLLRDEQAGIRTNTTVCLGKIARFLHPGTRQKVLIAAFTGKLRDPFPPARIAAINALAATQQYFTIQETSSRVLPALCTTLTDVEEPVRVQGFKVTQGFITKLEQVSKNPSLREEMEAEVLATNSKSSSASSVAAGWASWAVGAIGAKFYKSNVSTAPSNSAPSATGAASTDSSAITTNAGSLKVDSNTTGMENKVKHISLDEDTAAADDGNGWDDAEDWGSLEESAKPDNSKVDEDFFGETLKKPSIGRENDSKRIQKSPSPVEDSWDSWGGTGDPVKREKDVDKIQREEKRAARREEMAAKKEARKTGGPLKLGAKKD